MSAIDNAALDGLQDQLGYRFSNLEPLVQSLTHRSFANERAAASTQPASSPDDDNERLEFLGDAVLDLALSEHLMRRFPSDDEGGLSKKRASLVNEDSLAKLALEMKIESVLRVGRGEAKTGGMQKPRILASAFEAVLGAVFLDGGYGAAAGVVERAFALRIDEVGRSDVDFRGDFKTRLQERAQELFRATPTYRVERESGPDHDKVFEISVLVGERVLATGQGRNKKAAEQDAARQALETLA